jgi:hypothetical protein
MLGEQPFLGSGPGHTPLASGGLVQVPFPSESGTQHLPSPEPAQTLPQVAGAAVTGARRQVVT